MVIYNQWVIPSHAELTSHHLSPQTQDIVHMWNVVFDDFVVS